MFLTYRIKIHKILCIYPWEIQQLTALYLKATIQQYLNDLEVEKNIKILLACETGSRAWGFPSPDSDYDVRIIYVHRLAWYLRVNEKRDSIERMLENKKLDISGWELRKSLRLLKKSNPPLLERIQSPILYQVDEEFLQSILNASTSCYSKIATIHHYLSMAKNMMDSLSIDQPYKLKKFFYALRTATMCKWILEREEIPPIEFHKAFKNLGMSSSLVERIEHLIHMKSKKSEAYFHSGEPELFNFIQNCLANAEKQKDSLPPGKCNMEQLNHLLQTSILKYDH